MPLDNRQLAVPASGQEVAITKRAGDTFLFDVGAGLALGPEGWLNSAQAASTLRGPSANYFAAGCAVSGTEAWAVGHYFDINGVQQSLIEHFVTGAWAAVTTPQVTVGGQATSNYLSCVCAVSSSEVYAFGAYLDSRLNKWRPVSMKYNGTSLVLPWRLHHSSIPRFHH
jgi:hypothetical protein